MKVFPQKFSDQGLETFILKLCLIKNSNEHMHSKASNKEILIVWFYVLETISVWFQHVFQKNLYCT